jgi:hypothetical protein
VAKTRDGRAVALLPVDSIRWTAAFEKAANEVQQRAAKELGATKLELQISGIVSPTAKKELAAKGITVVENLPLTLEVAAAAAPAKK